MFKKIICVITSILNTFASLIILLIALLYIFVTENIFDKQSLIIIFIFAILNILSWIYFKKSNSILKDIFGITVSVLIIGLFLNAIDVINVLS